MQIRYRGRASTNNPFFKNKNRHFDLKVNRTRVDAETYRVPTNWCCCIDQMTLMVDLTIEILPRFQIRKIYKSKKGKKNKTFELQ